MKEPYISELQNPQTELYVHCGDAHLMADSLRRKALGFQIVPAVIAAFSAGWISLGASHEWLPILTACVVYSCRRASVLNPNKSYQEHLSAAKAFTMINTTLAFLRKQNQRCWRTL